MFTKTKRNKELFIWEIQVENFYYQELKLYCFASPILMATLIKFPELFPNPSFHLSSIENNAEVLCNLMLGGVMLLRGFSVS